MCVRARVCGVCVLTNKYTNRMVAFLIIMNLSDVAVAVAILFSLVSLPSLLIYSCWFNFFLIMYVHFLTPCPSHFVDPQSAHQNRGGRGFNPAGGGGGKRGGGVGGGGGGGGGWGKGNYAASKTNRGVQGGMEGQGQFYNPTRNYGDRGGYPQQQQRGGIGVTVTYFFVT